MWGGDSSGKRVRLLNDSPATQTTNHVRPPKLLDRSRGSDNSSSSSVTSSKSSYCTRSSRSSISPRSPGRSPPTPPVPRFDSRTSVGTRSNKSPMSSNYGSDAMGQPSDKNHNPSSLYSDYNRLHGYPSALDAQVQDPYYNLAGQQSLPPFNLMDLDAPYPQQHASHRLHLQQVPFPNDIALHPLSPSSATPPHTSADLPTSIITTPQNHGHPMQPPQTIHSTTVPIKPSPTTSNSTKASAAARTSSNKKYPCPHAQAYHCADTFTTSGHAARHGKKHTGEKNVQCPTCGKAFTRKDNMKQHERTHKNSTTSRTGSASPAMGSTKGQKSRRSSDATADAMDTDGDSTTAGSTHSTQASMNERPKMLRSELSEILENVSAGVSSGSRVKGGERSLSEDLDADGEGESPGLDALAIAAGAAGGIV